MKKNSKYKTIPRWLNYKPKYSGKGCEREKIKMVIPFLSYPTPKRKFQKNRKKIKKKYKNTSVASFQAKIDSKRLRNSENKN